jgi:hypothetical protein
MKRSWQRQTAVLLTPAFRMISARARTIGRQQHDLGAPDVLLGAVPIRHDRVQPGEAGLTSMEIPVRIP